jgi:hypothetical protein
MRQIWYGKTKYWDEIVEAFENQGFKLNVNKKQWTIEVEDKDYNQAYAILCELNEILEAGW